MNKPLVSIIIPLYNSEKYISECIESCLKQTFRDIEIVIIDDGSTDDGYNIAKQLAEKDSRIIITRTANNGVSSARNLGIEESHGDYICFIDADDSIEPQFVEVMREHLIKNDADFVFSMNTYEEYAGRKGKSKVLSASDAESLLLSPYVKVGCWNKMYSRKILDKIHFRTNLFYGEGLYFINQVAHESQKTVLCEDGLYHYRKVNPESATTKFQIEKMINGEESLLEIRKLINGDGRRVQNAWSQHYVLFCINAMRGILRSLPDENYKTWHKKAKKQLLKGLRAKSNIKLKIYMILWLFTPKMMNGAGR